jgi:hypothetical protein
MGVVENRFWSKVRKTEGCWIWTAYKNYRGYGQYSYYGRLTHAHRAAYRIVYGSIPEGCVICHRCDNPSCVRPDHLFAGTQLDNMRDMIKKGRRGKGAAKITREDARLIRTRHNSGETVHQLAESYNLHPTHISEIVRGLVWKEKDSVQMELFQGV